MTPDPFTRWYWPAALSVSVAAFITGTYTHLAGPALLAGCVLLGAPELFFLLTRQYASTFSDWVWTVLHIARATPVRQWTAAHFLALACYLALAVRVDIYLASATWVAFECGVILSCWLTYHLFWRRWA